jgi:hypothetical protein
MPGKYCSQTFPHSFYMVAGDAFAQSQGIRQDKGMLIYVAVFACWYGVALSAY